MGTLPKTPEPRPQRSREVAKQDLTGLDQVIIQFVTLQKIAPRQALPEVQW